MNIGDIRKDYKLRSLTAGEAATDAIEQFGRWWQEATESQIDEINAMTLCTVNADGRPQGRIVLLKGFDERGFTFFTNYQSHKGNELAARPYASLVFFWKELERQVRIGGVVSKVSAEESDAYFQSRPEGSRLGAWASPQSQVINDREVLEKNLGELQERFAGEFIPRPPHWGGYCVTPDSIEFWQGRPSRLHDRLLYTKENGAWRLERLAP